MKGTCLIIDEMHPSIVGMLQAIGIEAHYQPQVEKSEIKKIISAYDGIIIRSKIEIDQELLDAATKLKFIGRAGAGLDQIDLEAVKQKGVTILNAPEGNRDAVGEHAVGMLLSLMNNIHIADREVRSGTWQREKNRGSEIMGKTIGILGYGNMGQAFAKRINAFGCTVLAYDKYVASSPCNIARQVSMEEIWEKADVFSVHIPLTHESRKLVNDQFLQKFTKNIWIINTARGEIIDTTSLVDNMRRGKVLGAALDVLDNEKLDRLSEEQKGNFNFLAASESVILTPHIAGWTKESLIKINQILVDKIKAANILY